MKFNEILKKLRNRENLSQIELATRLNVNQYIISYWESGRSEPSIKQLIEISNVFNVPLDYLLGKETIVSNNIEQLNIVNKHLILDSEDDFTNKLITIYKDLNNSKKQEIFKIIENIIKITN